MPFKFRRFGVVGPVLIDPLVLEDSRGSFMETFKQSDFAKEGFAFSPVQENLSKSRRGVLRGLHYQINPAGQAKLVRVTRGRAFDVAVDLRRDSRSFSKWVGFELSEANKRAALIPRGFAHGFVALTDPTEVTYLVDNEYSKVHERGVIWNDSRIGIRWPVRRPILSERDAKWPELKEAEVFE